MKSILFVDPCCPIPYDATTLNTHMLGGTEATVIRVAECLAKKFFVVVCQHNRDEISKNGLALYSPLFKKYVHHPWDVIVVLRFVPAALEIKEQFPKTPIWVWLHDFVYIDQLQALKSLIDESIGFIVVSDFLKRSLLGLCKLDPFLPTPKIVRIYNPINDDLHPDDTPVDCNKLIFVSSIQKGLSYALKIFKRLVQEAPQFKLYVSNPSHSFDLRMSLNENIKILGKVTHAENIKEMRSSFCMFNLNHVFPETFGIALAEANAVGTPVLTHKIGAAPEVLSNNHEQIVNTHDEKLVIERLMKWYREGRPTVYAKEVFRLSRVCQSWENLFKEG